jgi:hypothetical protein
MFFFPILLDLHLSFPFFECYCRWWCIFNFEFRSSLLVYREKLTFVINLYHVYSFCIAYEDFLLLLILWDFLLRQSMSSVNQFVFSFSIGSSFLSLIVFTRTQSMRLKRHSERRQSCLAPDY